LGSDEDSKDEIDLSLLHITKNVDL
jgi:hypothetical protein